MKHNELPFVRKMFDRIAPHYDFLNRLLSLRRDVYWRRELAAGLGLSPGSVVLDVACGTADVALEIVRATRGAVAVAGVDFAVEMLRLAKPKVQNTLGRGIVGLAAADAFELPFATDRFDAVTIAFGIRNIRNKPAVLDSFRRHLKPGGRLAILELTTPQSGPLRSAYLFYFNRLLPLAGRFFSKHSFAYSYLPDSVAHFPAPDDFARTIRQSGFENVRYRRLTLGVATLFVADKPR